jgi:hypothetical protein
MLGVTFFGLLLTPVFYVILRAIEKLVSPKTRAPRELTHRPPIDRWDAPEEVTAPEPAPEPAGKR